MTFLRLHPDGKAASFVLGDREQPGILDLESGQVTHRHVPAVPEGNDVNRSLFPLAEGVFTYRGTAGSPTPRPWSPSLVPWSGSGWNVAPQHRRLSPEVRAVRTSGKSADMTGTATLDGRRLRVAGTLRTSDAVLAPQARLFEPRIKLDLNLQDGAQAVGHLNGRQAVPDLLPSGEPPPFPRAEPQYDVFPGEDSTSQSFEGQLRRPSPILGP